MSVARPARPESVEQRAPAGAGSVRARFAELLAAARTARPVASAGALGRARAEQPAHTGRAASHRPRPEGRAAFPAEPAVDLRPADPSSGGFARSAVPGLGPPDALAAAELRACVRSAPAAIASALRPGAAELALTFGSALSLDLRSGAQGLELTLRPASGLERATRAELPGLVDALRARGLRVARAEVRPRAPARRRAR